MHTGRQGLGSGRRIFAAASSAKAPTDAAVNGLIPVTHDEAASQIEYRNRARSDFEQKRDVTRLMKARKTLLELDEKRGISVGRPNTFEENEVHSLRLKQFNILWIDPSNLETIPETMQAQLKDDDKFGQQRWGEGMNDHHVDKDRLRAQMRSDSLRPLVEDVDYGVSIDDEVPKDAPSKGTMTDFDPDTIQDTKDWLLLSVSEQYLFLLDDALILVRTTWSLCCVATAFLHAPFLLERSPEPIQTVNDDAYCLFAGPGASAVHAWIPATGVLLLLLVWCRVR